MKIQTKRTSNLLVKQEVVWI